MAGSQPGDRAKKAALRERMRAAGLGHDEVAAELGRLYGLRRRTAWREARGWSLVEAAAQINEGLTRTGLDPDGVASMSASHLSEYEAWPGQAVTGGEVTGRKPKPYLLALLGQVYGCRPRDLVDVADREHLSGPDLMLLDEISRQPAAVVPVTPQADPRKSLELRAALPASSGGRGLPGLPGVTYLETGELPRQGRSWVEREVAMTADEGSAHAGPVEVRGIGDMALEELRAGIAVLSREYMTSQPFPVLQRMRELRGRVYTALDRRMWPRDQAELYLDASLINYLMAVATKSLGYPQHAETLIRAAWTYAVIIDHRPLMGKVRSEAGDIAYWDGRSRQAVDRGIAAVSFFSEGEHGAVINMHLASAAAAVGDADAVRQAIAAGWEARDDGYRDELLDMGGQFGLSRASQHYLSGRALMDLPSAGSDARAELERAAELYTEGPGSREDHSEEVRVCAHADLATARLRSGDLDAAVESLETVFALPTASRKDQISKRLAAGVRPELAGRRYQGSARAAELDERIEEFGRQTIVAALHELPGGAG